MNDETANTAGEKLARRRLLRGSFAAPVVLTMYSGGALALTSATCVAKAQTNPVTQGVATYVPPTPAPDTYLRIRLWISTNNTYWLRYDQISAFTGAAAIIATSNNYRQFIPSTNLLSTTAINVANPPGGTLTASDKWAALRFDGTGNLVGVGASGGGSAITGSCWTSTLAA